LPYEDAERLVIPATYNLNKSPTPENAYSIAFADYLDWRKEGIFEYVAAYSAGTADVTGQGEPERLNVALITEDYFQVMGAQPLLGRVFSDEENQGGGAPVVVISYGLWQRRFGGDANIIGQTINFNLRAYTIIGVMPRDSQYPDTVESWTPMKRIFNPEADPNILRRDNHEFLAIARLKKDMPLAQANLQLQALGERIAQDAPAIRAGTSLKAFSLNDWIIGTQLRRALLVLLAAVGLVLLIVCVNVANLLLARGAAREREIAIRLTLGASRLRLIKQLLTESLLLGVLGGVLGVLLSLWGVDLLIRLAPSNIPRLQEVSLDLRVLSFAFLASILTAIAIGLIPALRSSKADLNEAIKDGGRTASAGRRGQRLRSALVIAEVAISLVLLVGAGLMIKSFYHLQKVDLGFHSNNILTFDITLPRARYEPGEKVARTFRDVTERLKSISGVEAVSTTSALPLNGGGFYLGRAFLREGQEPPPTGSEYMAMWNVISPTYFNTMGIGLLKGRAFTEQDTAKSVPVVMINESLAAQMFPGEDPLGKRLKSWRDENLLREVVGIVRDVRYQSRDEDPINLVYVPHTQDTYRSMTLVVHTFSDPNGYTQALREAVWSIDKDLAMANVRTLNKVVDDSSARPRFNTLLLTLFAAVALLLASIGLYGVLSYAVTERTHEIGIRIALGARQQDVLKLVAAQGLKLTLIGVGIGLITAYFLTRLMETLLFDVSGTDTLTLVLVSLLLTGVALVASLVPARRAAKTDPMVALRYE
jgi:predicted permease